MDKGDLAARTALSALVIGLVFGAPVFVIDNEPVEWLLVFAQWACIFIAVAATILGIYWDRKAGKL
jgi:hypothetical protein